MKSKLFKRIRVVQVLGAVLMVWVGSAAAIDITISDKVYTTGWYGNREDNETEPGTVIGQQWDLERFDLSGNTLSLIGGYDFKNGVSGFNSGDLFIDVDGDAVYGKDVFGGSGNQYTTDSNTRYNYDYVVVFGRTTSAIEGGVLDGNYSIYRIDNETTVTAYYRQNDASNPFRLNPTEYDGVGDTAVLVGTGSLGFSSFEQNTPDLMGYNGNNTHNKMTVDLSLLASAEGIHLNDGTLFHFTVGCGNDSLIGYVPTSVPDGGLTLAMLGIAFIGLGSVSRVLARKRNP